ncbi:ANL_HP_G0187160.mRNA.1.CDS.1 [Saccharomyces cerevisiae]|nr:ANL_HP_G0187160.mRNA.1.CDS.1 [Saccharomyces cerevisiae]CAI6392579.1 ANL_HP_G0187160.mRNA.1.CDS.1 [Saccharomyces cerevisiae]
MSVINFTGSSGPLVKVCGLQSTEAAECALDSDADLLGIICVPNRKRTIGPESLKRKILNFKSI